MRTRIKLIWLLLLALTVLGERSVVAQSRRTADPNQIKSTYLLALSRYTEWPAGAFSATTQALEIAVLADTKFAEWVSKTAAGKSAGGRPFKVRTITDIAEIGSAHVLFIGSESDDQASAILAELGKKPVLVVSAAEQFLEAGGAVQFLPSRPFVTFGINYDAIEAAGLEISTKVLDSARKIIRNGRVRSR